MDNQTKRHNLNAKRRCWNCGKISRMWWEDGDRTVCEFCESFLDHHDGSQIKGETVVLSDGTVLDNE